MPRPKRRASPVKRQAARLLIVEARYYEDIADRLLAGATTALEQVGAQYDVVTVPGALEIPAAIVIAADNAARAGEPYDGAVALGCVIRGETFHFEIVSMESARGLMDLSVAHGFPIGNGILTVENEKQAKARLGGRHGDKGAEAARATLALIALKHMSAA